MNNVVIPYYTVLPPAVRYDTRIKPQEKVLYSELVAVSNCFNCTINCAVYAKLYSVKVKKIKEWLYNLEKADYILIVHYTDDNCIIKILQ